MFGFELVTCLFIHLILAMDSKSDIWIIAHLVSRVLGFFFFVVVVFFKRLHFNVI